MSEIVNARTGEVVQIEPRTAKAEQLDQFAGASPSPLASPQGRRVAVRQTDAGKSCAETDGDCPTEGRLFRVSWLIQATPQWLDSQS